jgi:hypothetical protein
VRFGLDEAECDEDDDGEDDDDDDDDDDAVELEGAKLDAVECRKREQDGRQDLLAASIPQAVCCTTVRSMMSKMS